MSEYICELHEDDHEIMELGHVGEEIIRCRDCKHYKSDGCRCRYFLSPHPSTVDGAIIKGVITMSYVDPDGFCAWAERSDDD